MDSENAPRSNLVDAQVLSDIANLAETVANLNYLIELEAHNPRLVRSYASQADERLRTLGSCFIRSARNSFVLRVSGDLQIPCRRVMVI